jgi:hypothetical protein
VLRFNRKIALKIWRVRGGSERVKITVWNEPLQANIPGGA